jgi:hypothetical protein
VATTFKWLAPEAIATYYTTELNSITTTTFVAVGAELANETDLYQYIMFELVLASLTPAAGGYIDIWADYQMDGTNYADAAKPLQTSALLTTLQLDTAAGAQRIVSRPALIYPVDFKLQLRNQAGVTLAASGNTLKYRRFFDQGV